MTLEMSDIDSPTALDVFNISSVYKIFLHPHNFCVPSSDVESKLQHFLSLDLVSV